MNTHKKSIIFDIGGVLFHHEILPSGMQKFTPIEQGISLLKKCYERAIEQGNRLFICTNMTHEGVERLREKYPEIFELFHGIVTSTSAQAKKPNPAIFEHLIKEHELQSEYAVFIDDQLENIRAAELMGLMGIHAHDFVQVSKVLEKHGFIKI